MKALSRPLPGSLCIVLGLALVAIAFLVWAWLNLQWAVMDQYPMPPEGDSFKYVLNAYDIADDALDAPGIPLWRSLYHSWRLHTVPNWNVFTMMIAACVVRSGPDRPAEIQSLLPFLLILVASAVALGWVTLGPAEGVLAGLILLCFPGVIGFSRISHLEVPAMAMAAWLPVLAWRASLPKRYLSALALGMLAGLGMFIRYEFPVYLFPAALFPIIVSLARIRPAEGRTLPGNVLRLLAMAFLAILGFAGIFFLYAYQLPDQSVGMLVEGLHQGPTSIEYKILPQYQNARWMILPTELARVTIEPVWTVLMLLGLPLLISLNREKWKPTVHLAVVIVAGIAFTGMFQNREARRLLMLLPCAAVLIAGGMICLYRLHRRLSPFITVLICIALILGSARVYALSFNPEAGADRQFLLERDIPSPPRPDDMETTHNAAVLLRYGNWPARSLVVVVRSPEIPIIALNMRTRFRSMEIKEAYRDPDGGLKACPLFDPITGPPDIVVSPDPEICGPETIGLLFDYADPETLAQLRWSLPPYLWVDTLCCSSTTRHYVLKRIRIRTDSGYE